MKTSVVAAFALVSFALAGCGSGGYSGPTGTVNGVVTKDGQPLGNVNVSFMSKEGFSISGQADASGKFSLQHNGSSNVPVGSYQAAVTPAAGAADDPGQYMEAEPSAGPDESAIPMKFRSFSSSGLSFEVKEGANDLALEISTENAS